MQKSFYILLISLFGCTVCPAQVNSNDSPSTRQIKFQNTYNLYASTIDGAAKIYNGPEYIGSYRNVLGSPYFEADDFTTGAVYYEGIKYYAIPLKYDLVKNELVTKSAQNESISLNMEKVDSFFLMKQIFIRIPPGKAGQGLENEDYYQLLYGGRSLRLVAKKWKTISALRPENPSTFSDYTNWYIFKNGVYHKISNKKNLLKLLKDKKSTINTFSRKENLKFKKDFEDDIRKVVQYYDQLN